MIGNDEKLRLKELLSGAILLLCKNGLPFSEHFSLEALIGVTLDQEEVVLFSFNETIHESSKNSNIDQSSSVSEGNESQRNTHHTSSQMNQDISNIEETRQQYIQRTGHLLNENSDANIKDDRVIDSGAGSSQTQFKLETEDNYEDNDCVYVDEYEQYDDVNDMKTVRRKNYTDYIEYEGLSDTNKKSDKGSSMSYTNNIKRSHALSSLSLRHQSTHQRGFTVKRTISESFRKRRRNEPIQEPYDTQHNDVNQISSILEQELDSLTSIDSSSVEPLLECQVCGTRLKGKRTLREHIRGTHLNLYSYSCPDCYQGFKWRSSLKNHRAQCHGQTSASMQRFVSPEFV